MRRWCSGIMQDSHSCDPGSIPGRRKFFLPKTIDYDRTRTCNPQIRSLVPYPLGHAVYNYFALKYVVVINSISIMREIQHLQIDKFQCCYFNTKIGPISTSARVA